MDYIKKYTNLYPSNTEDIENINGVLSELILLTGIDHSFDWKKTRPSKDLDFYAQLFTQEPNGATIPFCEKVWGNSEVDAVVRLFNLEIKTNKQEDQDAPMRSMMSGGVFKVPIYYTEDTDGCVFINRERIMKEIHQNILTVEDQLKSQKNNSKLINLKEKM